MDEAREHVVEYFSTRVFAALYTLLVAGEFEKAEKLFDTFSECTRIVTILIERCKEAENLRQFGGFRKDERDKNSVR